MKYSEQLKMQIAFEHYMGVKASPSWAIGMKFRPIQFTDFARTIEASFGMPSYEIGSGARNE